MDGPGCGIAKISVSFRTLPAVRIVCSNSALFIPGFPERSVSIEPLSAGEYPSEGGDLSEVPAVQAGVKGLFGYVVGCSSQDLFPFVQQWRRVWVDRPHVGDVATGDLYYLCVTGPEFFDDLGVKKQASLLVAGHRGVLVRGKAVKTSQAG